MFVVDHEKKKMLHFASNPESDIIDLFNKEFEREFVTNVDYIKVGGDRQTWTADDSEVGSEKTKKFLKSHWLRPSTSQFGTLNHQKKCVPEGKS